MSGRSAYARAKKGKPAEDKARTQQQQHAHCEDIIYGMSGPPSARPIGPVDPPFRNSDTSLAYRRHSISSGSSSYNYALSPTTSRPGMVQSSVEKSEFRHHLDGMSKNVRGKLGKLIKGADDHHTNNHNAVHRSRVPTTYESSETGSRSTELTPSATAAPSLDTITPLRESYGPALASPKLQLSKARAQHAPHLPIQKFEGGGRGPQPGWKKMTNSPELWDDNGDTYVYMYMRGSRTKPPPSFRIHSSMIFESGSKIFISQLRDRSVPVGWPRLCHSDMHCQEDPIFAEDRIEPMDLQEHILPRSGAYLNTDEAEYDFASDNYRRVARHDDGILHEIYVAWPGSETGVHSTLWHITTRNFFAVLCDANSLIGTTLFECLTRLWDRLVTYPDYLSKKTDRVKFIADYVLRHNFDDVRNSQSYAASLLAFSELPDIQWRAGYIEAYVHCVGMLNAGLQSVPEWRLVMPNTKMFIENASLEMEERIYRAQRWFFSFDFTEMWPTTSAPPSASHAAFDRLRRWLAIYYGNVFLHWPPTAHDQVWLTHGMVDRLRRDFHGLYDHLVNREIIFDGTEYRPGQKWTITGKSGQSFRADTPDLAFTDILLAFDQRHDFPHIPHPYPHTPTSIPVLYKAKTTFQLKKSATASEVTAQSFRKARSYADASNVYFLRNQIDYRAFVTDFIKFEKTDQLDHVDPFEARRGRWLLIYGILQVLATISVDSPNLRYRDGVRYHISPQMKGVVPWAENGTLPEDEACHTRSHCWTVPSTWAPTAPKAKLGSHKPILWGQYGDGRCRADDKNQVIEVHETTTSFSRLRAEEWVNNTAPNQTDIRSEASGVVKSTDYTSNSEGRKDSGLSSGDVRNENSIADSNDSSAAARFRQVQTHKLTNFQVPPEWNVEYAKERSF
ncbi:hypothetical protein MMC13_006706 [Lambiella insularis]|nr:hypothetical protein [Lambiella insularis]